MKGASSNIQIIGIGCVGSQIASELLDINYFDNINLVDKDKNKAKGNFYDLLRVKKQRKLRTNLSWSPYPTDKITFNVISLGSRRDFKRYGKDVNRETFKNNMPIVMDIMRRFKKNGIGTFIIVTHPARMIARTLRVSFPNFSFYHAGDIVDSTGIDGKKIQELKGFTSFGIAAEVADMIIPKPIPVRDIVWRHI